MQNPGRGRRTAVAFVLALVCAALAPAAASADSISFRPPGVDPAGWIDAFPNETRNETVKIQLNWDDAEHLVPGSQVRLEPGPLPPGFSAAPVTINVPSDWSLGKSVLVQTVVTYTTTGTIHPTQDHYLIWNPTSRSCTLGTSSCLVVGAPRRIDVRTSPHNVENFEVKPGVIDARLTWDHSPEHLQLTHYRLLRFRVGGGEPVKFLYLSPATTSYHDEGLTPDTEYCWRLASEKIIEYPGGGNQVLPGPSPEPTTCLRTGKHPGAPASAPAGPALDADGEFSLTWGQSPDNGVTYEVEHRDTNDADFRPLASGLTAPSYPANEDEGTWSYRVRAHNEQGGWSDWVASSNMVKVDKTAPSVRGASTQPSAAYSGDWFKDTVNVSFGPSTDPELVDTSAGSGVVSQEGGGTFDTTGTHTATGTATDDAGHTSTATKTVKVDATAPELTASGCRPSGCCWGATFA